MKKSNVLLQAAIAGALMAMVGSAYAQTSTSVTSVAYATEQFLGTTPSAAVLAPSINVITGTAIPAGSVITAMVQLTGGIWAGSISGVIAGATQADAVVTNTAGGVGAVSFGATGTGVTTAASGVGATASATANNANVLRITHTTASAVGIGATLFVINTPTISAAGLATTAGTVTATSSIFTGTIAAPLGAAVPTTGLLEVASAAGTVATAVVGTTQAVAANTSTAKIDLTAATAATKFSTVTASATETASTTVYKLGTFTVTDGSGKLVTAGNGAYTSAARTTVATMTGTAGFFAPLGTTGTITLHAPTGAACGAAASATSATFTTAALAAAATTLSAPAIQTTTGTAYDVCMTVNGTTVIAAGTPSLGLATGVAVAQNSVSTFAATALETLALNGASYDVRNYVPLAATGYTTFVRVINTGSVSAAVSAALVNETTGVVGTAGVLGTLAAGAAVNYTSTQVEAAAGTVAATARPRIRITAPTNGMNVQTFLASPNGNITDMTGAQ